MRSSVSISVCLKGTSTRLQHSYFTPPFRLADITAGRNAHQLDLMLMCSSPGILDNDQTGMDIMVEAGASLQLHTQSYQRLFQMKKGAEQRMNIHVKEAATFIYLPHPAVPHAASVFTGINHIFLSNNSTLLWGEIITCGRQVMNESFAFSKYHNLTEIFLNDKLVIRENLFMQPSRNNLQSIGQLEGFTHQASLTWVTNENPEEKTKLLLEFLALQPSVEYGVSKTPVNGFIVRMLGYKAEQLHDCLKAMAALLLKSQVTVTSG